LGKQNVRFSWSSGGQVGGVDTRLNFGWCL